jgi:hypothetical protein
LCPWLWCRASAFCCVPPSGKSFPMSKKAEHGGQSDQPDTEDKKVAAMAIRLPILILAAILLMAGMGVLAMQMYGG